MHLICCFAHFVQEMFRKGQLPNISPFLLYLWLGCVCICNMSCLFEGSVLCRAKCPELSTEVSSSSPCSAPSQSALPMQNQTMCSRDAFKHYLKRVTGRFPVPCLHSKVDKSWNSGTRKLNMVTYVFIIQSWGSVGRLKSPHSRTVLQLDL